MKPILFNTPMVQAILAGTKTQTRRVVKPQPSCKAFKNGCCTSADGFGTFGMCSRCIAMRGISQMAKYKRGDVLYVRETWAKISDWATVDPSVGIPDGFIYREEWPDGEDGPKWRPSIHMPREAARIFLRVTDVRVERLQDITVDGINAEGVDVEPPEICRNEAPSDEQREKYNRLSAEQKEEYIQTLARHKYMGWMKYVEDLFRAWKRVWDSTIKPTDRDRYVWNANPWVWVYSFERISKEETEAALKEVLTDDATSVDYRHKA